MNVFEHINVCVKGCYAVIGIRKEPANALTIQDCIDIKDAMGELNKDDKVRAIIITGDIRYSFFTGSDLDEIYAIMKKNGEVSENMVSSSKPVQDAFNDIEKSPKVTIAVVNGLAIGLGCELALACDIRIINGRASFRFAQTGIGIIPGAGGTQRLPQIVGVAKAKELIFTARKVSADEAMRIGLVNAVTPFGKEMEFAEDMAERIAANTGAQAVRLAKEAINFNYLYRRREGMDAEMECFGQTYYSEDAFVGIEAAMLKSKVNFNSLL
jgi:enoyl-CoA hydratase/carnithine racemase